MATENYKQEQKATSTQENKDLLSPYLGLSFTIFLAFQSHEKALSLRLHQAECELKDLYSKRKEDAKANARVVEIFASYRHAWMQEEKRLLHQIDEGAQEIEILRARLQEFEKSEVEYMSSVEDLKREIYERDALLSFMLNSSEGGNSCFVDTRGNNMDTVSCEYGDLSSIFWAEREKIHWQNAQHQSLESEFCLKPFVSRRESPWKMDDEITEVFEKLKLLEHELVNFKKYGNIDLLKTTLMSRNQAKRYLGLAERIDDLCRRMQTSDPYEPESSHPEFKTQWYTEFLVEAYRLQQLAFKTGQKLIALSTETRESYFGNEVDFQAKLITTINNFKDIQRKFEIWLARIIGDVEGTLSRKCTS